MSNYVRKDKGVYTWFFPDSAKTRPIIRGVIIVIIYIIFFVGLDQYVGAFNDMHEWINEWLIN